MSRSGRGYGRTSRRTCSCRAWITPSRSPRMQRTCVRGVSTDSPRCQDPERGIHGAWPHAEEKCGAVAGTDLRIEMARQRRGLMKHTQGSNREINRQKNSLNVQHRAKTLESKCPLPSSLVIISDLDFRSAHIVCFACLRHTAYSEIRCARTINLLGAGPTK